MWLAQPLTELRNLLGGYGRPARSTDNLTAICEANADPRRLTNLWAPTACRTNEEIKENICGFLTETCKTSEKLKSLAIDGRIILKMM
jgi:hypothetical protein